MSTVPAFGRAGAPRSHRVAFCPEARTSPGDTGRIAFTLPNSLKSLYSLPSEHALRVAELRGNGHYTMFPPSTHPNGELVEWFQGVPLRPPEVSWDELRLRAGLIAFLAVMVRFYLTRGCRNDFCLALSGALLRALSVQGTKEPVEAVDRIVKLVAELARDEEAHTRGQAARTWTKIKSDMPATGLPSIVKMLALPDDCLQTFNGWLGVDSDERPKYLYSDADIPRLLDKAEAAFVCSGAPIYQMGGRIVHPVRLDAASDEDGVRRHAGTLLIQEIGPHPIREYMVEAVRWFRVIRARGGPIEVPCAPPLEFARHFLARADKWRVPATA